MPRIKDEVLNCAFYLYKTEADAKRGTPAGGSGFFIFAWHDDEEPLRPGLHRPDRRQSDSDVFDYAVTCSHVVKKWPVIRCNSLDGTVRIFPLTASDWVHHPTSDLAVASLRLPCHELAFNTFPLEWILDTKEARDLDVGVGDDVVMVGRFINLDGKVRNEPAARFGNVSALPTEPLRIDGIRNPQEVILVETRTVEGFSGSPVILAVPWWELESLGDHDPRRKYLHDPGQITRLLGVAGGYLYGQRSKIYAGENGEVEGWRVASNTGMMWCVPAWKLLDLLDDLGLKARREAARKIPPGGAPC